MKCDVSFEEMEQDAFNLMTRLNDLDQTHPFTLDDCVAAFKGYDERYSTLSVDFINLKFRNVLPTTKRNYRKQAQHIKIMNAIREIEHPNGEWINKDGAPTKQDQVHQWRLEHPIGKKAQCIRDTGLSKPTVYKWWNAKISD